MIPVACSGVPNGLESMICAEPSAARAHGLHRPPARGEVAEPHAVLELPAARFRRLHRVGIEHRGDGDDTAAVVVHRDGDRGVDLARRREQHDGQRDEDQPDPAGPRAVRGRGGRGDRAPIREPEPASSTGGGSIPSMARKTISSSSASTTIVSPAWNSFHRIFSESGSSIMRWIARRSGRAPERRVVALRREQQLGVGGELEAEALALELLRRPA